MFGNFSGWTDEENGKLNNPTMKGYKMSVDENINVSANKKGDEIIFSTVHTTTQVRPAVLLPQQNAIFLLILNWLP